MQGTWRQWLTAEPTHHLDTRFWVMEVGGGMGVRPEVQIFRNVAEVIFSRNKDSLFNIIGDTLMF